MNIAEKHDRFLRWAEMQFLFVQHAKSALYSRDSATGEMGGLPTDKFCGWTYGAHAMSKDELTLDFDDATMAAAALEHTITMNLAVWIRHAFQDVAPDARDNPDWNIRSAFEISRLIRNAFSHNPADPHWSIDPLCRNQVFVVDGVITLDTNEIDGSRFDWRHYGGPLALYRLSQWVRANLLTPQTSES